LINKLKEAFPNKYEQMTVVALAILENGKIDGYDGLDKQISEKDINTFNSIVGIEWYHFFNSSKRPKLKKS